MNRRQERVLRSVDQVLAFLTADMLATPRIKAARVDLEGIRTRLWETRTAQTTASKMRGARGVTIRNLRRDLRQRHLLPIVRRGKLLLAGLPGIDDTLRVPHSRSRDAELLAAAERIISAVRPHRRVFLKAGFAGDFVRQAERAAKAFATAATSESTSVGQPGNVTARMRDELANARQIIGALDSLICADFADDPSTLRTWRHAKRIPNQLGRPRAPRRAASTRPGQS